MAMLKRVSMGLALVVMPLLVGAQVPNEGLANAVLAARQKNAAMMAQYSWNSRSELIENGTTQDTRIDQVVLGPDGNLQRTLINDQPGKLPGGFLRKAVEENQRKKTEKYLKGLSKLMDQYTLPGAGKVLAFIVTAQVQPVTTPMGTTVLQMTGNNVVEQGDSFTLSVDGTSMHTTRVQISTTYEGSAVTLDATFRTGPTGLNHLQFATISVPDKNITLMVHNYDYVPQN